MAENNSSMNGGDAAPSMDEITSGLNLGQSKAVGDHFIAFSGLEDPREGKNKMVMVCQHCKCKVIRPGYATLVDKEVHSGFWLALVLFWL